MKINAVDHRKKNERFRANRFRLSKFQTAVEHEAIRFRAELGISEFVELPLDRAVARLPNCEVMGLKHVPGITLQQLSYAREQGYRSFGALACRVGEAINIVFNDALQPAQIRVYVMEEVFHLLLGHRPNILSFIPVDGNCRTYDSEIEKQAYGCAIASLVPFSALQGMLTHQTHIRRIAEHFSVPLDVVDERVAATNLGDLMNMQFRQLALVPEGL
jgi:Zn-dependent peptidase ImmA (M78 family)